ncbi:hypothetical protein M433DRAFT_367939 [Acidomyces richmondensis BFW]|nr:hypothetical protein M433DRAFT_367939 [Acidomyces richmondensis BFW]
MLYKIALSLPVCESISQPRQARSSRGERTPVHTNEPIICSYYGHYCELRLGPSFSPAAFRSTRRGPWAYIFVCINGVSRLPPHATRPYWPLPMASIQKRGRLSPGPFAPFSKNNQERHSLRTGCRLISEETMDRFVGLVLLAASSRTRCWTLRRTGQIPFRSETILQTPSIHMVCFLTRAATCLTGCDGAATNL